MTKYRFREVNVFDGTEVALPYGVLALSIRREPSREGMSVVTWLEEVPLEMEL